MGLLFTIAPYPRQHSHYRARVPRDSWQYSTVSDSTLPNLEGQIPLFIYPRNRVAQLYPPAPGSLFCRLLRLAGLWRMYSNPPPHGVFASHVLVHALSFSRFYKSFMPSKFLLGYSHISNCGGKNILFKSYSFSIFQFGWNMSQILEIATIIRPKLLKCYKYLNISLLKFQKYLTLLKNSEIL
jgi:hypothetical protein